MLILLSMARAYAQQCPIDLEYARDECLCYCRALVYLFPPPDTVVPTNTLFRVRRVNTYRWLRNGELFPMIGEGSTEGATDQMISFLAEAPLFPGDELELWTHDVYPPLLLGTWTIGDGPDTTPPRWDGGYEVETIDTPSDACGWAEHSHYVTFPTLTDDWPGGHLFVLAEGIEEFVGSDLGDEHGFDVRWDGCLIEDIDSYEQFHRSYRVTVFDAAGNATGPHEVRTGRNGCGCRGPDKEEYERVLPPPMDIVGVITLPFLWTRRRRSSQTGGPRL